MKTKSIYKQLKKMGAKIEHHLSDLYIKDTPKVRKMINNWLQKNGNRPIGRTVCAEFFISQIDGKLWIDLPFQYEPYYTKRGKK